MTEWKSWVYWPPYEHVEVIIRRGKYGNEEKVNPNKLNPHFNVCDVYWRTLSND